MKRKRDLFFDEPMPRRTASVKAQNSLQEDAVLPEGNHSSQLAGQKNCTVMDANDSLIVEGSASSSRSNSFNTDISSDAEKSSDESSMSTDSEEQEEATIRDAAGRFDSTTTVQGQVQKDSFVEADACLKSKLSCSSETTRGDALLMCQALGLRYSLPWSAIVDMLKMINISFGKNVVESSKYFFLKYMEAGKKKLSYHLYCDYCHRYLGRTDEIVGASLDCSCGEKISNVNQTKDFFLSLNLGEQVKELLGEKGFVDALQYRFIRKKENLSSYEDVYDGECYKKLSAPGAVLCKWHNLSYQLNLSGFPVRGKSGQQTCWSVYAQIQELPPKMRSKFTLLAGLYVGKKKPNMHMVMCPFVKEANFLSTVGIYWMWKNREVNTKLIPLSVCVDTPTREKLLNLISFKIALGCALCHTDPESIGEFGLRYTACVTNLTERTHRDVLSDAARAYGSKTQAFRDNRPLRYLRGPIPIHNLLHIDLVKCVRPDFMHATVLGNAKHYISVLTAYCGQPFYIGSEVKQHVINKRLVSIRPPSCLPVRRHFGSWNSWKANEWLAWVLFYAIPCLLEIIPEKYANHLNLLSVALHIVLQKSISESDLDKMDTVVKRFVELFEMYFKKAEMVYDIHLLLHMKRSIQLLGPGFTHLAFAYEASNKFQFDRKKSSTCIAKEIAHQYLNFKYLPMLCEKFATTVETLKFCEELSGCHSLKSSQLPERVSLLGKPKVVELTQEEKDCLVKADYNIPPHTKIHAYEIFLMDGVRYCSASYAKTCKTDDSFISVNGGGKARIKKILRCAFVQGTSIKHLALLVRELLIDKRPFLNDDVASYSIHQRIEGEGDLIAISPKIISGQCVGMFLESGNFICAVPYGCYGDISNI